MTIIQDNKRKNKGIALFIFIILLCSSIPFFITNSGAISNNIYTNDNSLSVSSLTEEVNSIKPYNSQENKLENIVQESTKDLIINSEDDSGTYGVWLRTEYDDNVNAQKLNIGIIKFFIMLTLKTEEDFIIDLENPGDTKIKLRFLPITKNIEGEGKIKVIQTDFIIETNCDTSKEYLVNLEVRFPFNLIQNTAEYVFNTQSSTFKNIHNRKMEFLHTLLTLGKCRKSNNDGLLSSKKYYHKDTTDEAYFTFRTGFSSQDGNIGPKKVTTSFYFGKDSIWDPLVIGKKENFTR